MAIFDTSAGKGNALARVVYAKYVEPQWNTSRYLHNYFSATQKETASLLETKVSLQLNGNFSVSALSDGGSLAAVGSSHYRQISVPFAHPVVALGITGQAIDIIKSGASVTGGDIVSNEMTSTVDAFLKTLNFLDWGDGTGVIATLVGTETNPHTTNASKANNFGRYVRQGMKCDIIQSDLATAVTSLTAPIEVSSVSNTGVITWTASQTYANNANDVVVLTNTLNAAPKGMGYHILNSGTYYGLSRTSYPILQSFVSDEAATELSLGKLSKLLANVKRSSGRFNQGSALFLMHYDQMQVLHEIGFAMQRYTGKIGTFEAGPSSVSLYDIPCEVDDDAPIAEVYLIDRSTFFLVTAPGTDSPTWLSGPDGQIWHATPNTASDGRGGYKYSYEADMHIYYNIASKALNRSGKLTNLQIPDGYTTWVV